MCDLQMFEGRSRGEQIKLVRDCLVAYGISAVPSRNRRGLKSTYYLGETAVYGVVHKPSSKEEEFVLVDRDFYEQYLADGKGTISLVRCDGKLYYKAILSREKTKNPVHRKTLEAAGCDLEGKVVDHIVHERMINTRDFLRPCTGSQNAANRINAKKQAGAVDGDVFQTDYREDFAYNPVLDFRDTWYALVLYKMTGISGEEVCAYNRDYMRRQGRL